MIVSDFGMVHDIPEEFLPKYEEWLELAKQAEEEIPEFDDYWDNLDAQLAQYFVEFE